MNFTSREKHVRTQDKGRIPCNGTRRRTRTAARTPRQHGIWQKHTNTCLANLVFAGEAL